MSLRQQVDYWGNWDFHASTMTSATKLLFFVRPQRMSERDTSQTHRLGIVCCERQLCWLPGNNGVNSTQGRARIAKLTTRERRKTNPKPSIGLKSRKGIETRRWRAAEVKGRKEVTVQRAGKQTESSNRHPESIPAGQLFHNTGCGQPRNFLLLKPQLKCVFDPQSYGAPFLLTLTHM